MGECKGTYVFKSFKPVYDYLVVFFFFNNVMLVGGENVSVTSQADEKKR